MIITAFDSFVQISPRWHFQFLCSNTGLAIVLWRTRHYPLLLCGVNSKCLPDGLWLSFEMNYINKNFLNDSCVCCSNSSIKNVCPLRIKTINTAPNVCRILRKNWACSHRILYLHLSHVVLFQRSTSNDTWSPTSHWSWKKVEPEKCELEREREK